MGKVLLGGQGNKWQEGSGNYWKRQTRHSLRSVGAVTPHGRIALTVVGRRDKGATGLRAI